MQASCAFPDPPWLWSASCIARRMRTWRELSTREAPIPPIPAYQRSAFRIERLLAKVEAEVERRGLRARRYVFHPDEMAEAEAQGLPYVLLPRVLSSREWMERYGEQPARRRQRSENNSRTGCYRFATQLPVTVRDRTGWLEGQSAQNQASRRLANTTYAIKKWAALAALPRGRRQPVSSLWAQSGSQKTMR